MIDSAGALELGDRAAHDDAPAVLAGVRADVDDPVRGADGVLVVLDHDQRVAEVLQPDERLDQPVVVALVQPDRRLVQDVEHADQAGPDLGREPDALRLAARQRRCRAVEGQVVQADVDEEAEPGVDLLQHPLADDLLARVEVEAVQPLGRLADRQRGDLGDRAAVDGDREDLGLEPGALARRARDLAHEPLVLLARVVALGLGVASLDPRHDALVVRVVRAVAAVPVAVADVHLLAGAVQDRLLRPRRAASPTPCRRRSPPGRRRPGAGGGSTRSSGRSPTVRRRPRPATAPGRGRPVPGRPPSGCRARCTPGTRRTGELNENERGSSSSIANGWSFGQASRSE